MAQEVMVLLTGSFSPQLWKQFGCCSYFCRNCSGRRCRSSDSTSSRRAAQLRRFNTKPYDTSARVLIRFFGCIAHAPKDNYASFTIKGSDNVDEDVERFKELREVLGPDFPLEVGTCVILVSIG